MKHDLPNFALLIDADNDTPDIIAPIIEEITRDARLSVRRVYGDFTTPHLAKWRETLANHGIHPIQQYQNSVGKNASDSALIIDAMDLLHGRRLDGFCLVSSDGDFTRLATRIREDGLSVVGFGRKHAPKAFVSACERYTYVENLGFAPESAPPAASASVPVATSAQSSLGSTSSRNGDISPEIKSRPPTGKSPATEHIKLKSQLLRAYTNVADEDGWALVSRIALYLRANHSDFDPRSHGASNFIKLLQTSGSFELKQRKQGNGTAHFCRPTKRPMSTEYIAALKAAVATGQGIDGWTSLAAIGNHLRENGYNLESSGCASLTEAMHACGLFDMRDASGAHKDFRLGKRTA
ncbi:hypothetical protein AT959_07590 [Dechloromonas denitrificans]|uniref:HTH OST-type domain-containing protein n=1 Tax=Dechloromonas denitrificans TaxID=281362 RepID=A0A133XKN8_9RHOO|nr:NYN domain-containing protein [Dechloromonas denitrificans]KXB31511.1 hypothetical protein AT959_07590 [Dechloromonas denitrificans]